MRRILSYLLITSVAFISSTVFALTDTKVTSKTNTTPTTTSTTTQQMNGAWTCTTNASSAPSDSAEEKADKEMANNARIGDEAFKFALQHCRDCTKISCYISNQGTTTSTTSGTTSTTKSST